MLCETLHLQKARSGEGGSKELDRKPMLSTDQEEELEAIILGMEARLVGLTQNEVRNYVFLFCETNKIRHPFNHDEERAGKDWLADFLRRHPGISLRINEPTSIQRGIGFNKAQVDTFMNLFFRKHTASRVRQSVDNRRQHI